MTDPKNQKENIINSDNNAIPNEQLTTENIVKKLDLIIAKPDSIKNQRKEIINELKRYWEMLQTTQNELTKKQIRETREKLIIELRELDFSESGLTWNIVGNKLYHMKESERKELAECFTGLERILCDRLNEKVGTKQASTAHLAFVQTVGAIGGVMPFAGSFQSNALIPKMDNLLIALEKSFSVEEVREIVKENSRELGKEMEAIKNWVIRMTDEQKHELEERDKIIAKKQEEINEANKKGNQLLEQKKEVEKEKEKLESKNQNLEASCGKLEETKNNLESKVSELIQKDNGEIEQLKSEQKLLETAEQVAVRNLREIKADYEELEKKLEKESASMEEKLKTEKNKSSELLALATKLDVQKNIAAKEADRISKEKLALELEKFGLETQKQRLEHQKQAVELESFGRKNEIFGLNTQKAQLEVTITGLKGDIEVKELELKNRMSEKDAEIADWTKALESEVAENKENQAKAEQLRLDFLALRQERDELKNSMSPQWLQKTFYRIDWALGTNMEKSATSFWSKSKSYGRLSLLILVILFFVYIGSWIVRVLVAIGRNIKAMFSKKQDPKEVLTEFLQTAKEAKDQLKKSPDKKEEKVIIEAEEIKEVKASPVESKPAEVNANLSEEKLSSETKESLPQQGKKRKRTKKKKLKDS